MILIKEYGYLKNSFFLIGILLIILSFVIVEKNVYLPIIINIKITKINLTAIISLWITLIKTIVLSQMTYGISIYWWVNIKNKTISSKTANANTKSVGISGILSIFNMSTVFIFFTIINVINLLVDPWAQQGYYISNITQDEQTILKIPYLDYSNDKFYNSIGSMNYGIFNYKKEVLTSGLNILNGYEPITYDDCIIDLGIFYGTNLTCNTTITNIPHGSSTIISYNSTYK